MKKQKLTTIGENMEHTFTFRLRLFACCAAFTMLAFASFANAQDPRSGNVKTDITKVKTFSGLAIIPAAGASLSRNNVGAYGSISTSGLAPGTVVTLWWAIFNNPSSCAASVCTPADLNNPSVNGSLQYGGGRLVGIDGRVDFAGYLAVGDNTGYYRLPMFPNMPDPAPGIVSTKEAQIHLVIRTHGAASQDPTILNEQLTSFAGGCAGMPSPCANIQAAVFGN